MLTAVGVIGVGTALCGWTDRFHLAVGLPVLGAEVLVLRWWQHRTQGEEEDFFEEEEAGLAHSLSVGVLGGMLSLLLLASSFWGATVLGIAEWFGDCSNLRAEVHTLQKGSANAYIIHLIDERLRRPLSATCQAELTEQQVWASLRVADTMTGAEQITKLEETAHLAAAGQNVTLQQLVDARQQLARAEADLSQQREMLKRQDIQLRQQQETIQEQSAKMTRQQEILKQQSTELARTRALLRALQQNGVTVRKPREGAG